MSKILPNLARAAVDRARRRSLFLPAAILLAAAAAVLYAPAGGSVGPLGSGSAPTALAAPQPAQDVIPPGFDLFETDPVSTRFKFMEEFTIPGDFFDPGCAPFSGTVNFKGLPIGSFMGRATGTADTVVERKAPINVPPPLPASDTIPIELLQLSLASTVPITVVCPGGDQIWDLKVSPSPSAPSTGKMTVTKTSPTGGTFTSTITVLPVFTFTRHTDLAVRVLDVGALPLPPESLRKLRLKGRNADWVHSAFCPLIVLNDPVLSPEFCGGARQNGKTLTEEQARLARHGVLPAQRKQCFCQP